MDITIGQVEQKKTSVFWPVYGVFCCVLAGLTIAFLLYVWKTIALYEEANPVYVVEDVITALGDGKKMELIAYPEIPQTPFSDADVVKEQYEDILKTAPLTYRFAKENFVTGEKEYYLYAADEAIGKLLLTSVETEKRLGFLQINRMKAVKLEPVLDIATWNYTIQAYSNQTVYVNDVEVSAAYQTGEKAEADRFKYLYEYGEFPYLVTYRIDGLYQKPDIRIEDREGQEIAYEENENCVEAMECVKTWESIPQERLDEIDVMKAAQTWSLFTTKDLPGPNNGLQTVRQYFIKDSYLWKKLGEYAYGTDISFISGHLTSQNVIDEERITEYQSYGEDCFSCRIHFMKHMWLTRTGKEQLDETDSYFYFLRVDDTDDGIDNPTWKIADIQAAVK